MASTDRRDGDPSSPRTVRAVHAIAVVIATLILAAVLNADSLARDAQNKPFGKDRDRWMGIWRPFQQAADALQLDQPRHALDNLIGRGEEPRPAFVMAPAPSPIVVEPERSNPPPVATATAPPAAPTPTPQPTIRAPAAGAPLRLWVGGDSLAIRFGESLVRIADDSGMIDARLDARISTGLARPDYFDWPQELARVTGENDPDIMVMLFGSNDSQGIMDPAGEVFRAHSEGWQAEYRRRVAQTMDMVAAPDRLVVWVGLPPMRDGDFSARLAEIDRIYREEADHREGVIYVDTWRLFSDNGGHYIAYLDDGGNVAQVREPDGVHLTRAGGDRLADAVMQAIGEHVILAPSATTAPEH